MKKETIKENHITAFYSLNLGLFANIKKKTFWRLASGNSVQDWVYLSFTRPKNVLGIIPEQRYCASGMY